MSSKTILVVDDEKPIRDMIAVALEMADFRVLEASEVRQAHALIIDKKPDLLLIDWMMPGVSGLEFVKRLRADELTQDIPIVMLTAKDSEKNKIQGLEFGADDFVTKPFSPRELVARLKAVLRRTLAHRQKDVIGLDGLVLDPNSHRVMANEQPVNLGPTEYRLLNFFLSHPERVYSRSQLLDHIWGGNVYIEERTVDVHIRRLRQALESEGYDRYVQTVRGSGYLFSGKYITCH